MKKKTDTLLFFLLIGLALLGFFIFSSASLGLLSREGARFELVAGKQLAILLIGFLVSIAISHIPYQFWRKYALYIFVFSLIATALVFVPGIGLRYGGASRWLNLGPISFQPSELLKFGVILYLATWFSAVKNKVQTISLGVVPYLIITGMSAGIILAQPDMGTCIVMLLSSFAVFFAAGPNWKHILALIGIGILGLGIIALVRPYARDRIMTFIDPAADKHGASYQITQSWIAIGSGHLTGRGFGQSIQKFNYLPEPIGDSIFAVASEEFGFIGSSLIILAFLMFGLWGLKIATRVTDTFGRLLTVGIVIMITGQAFANIAAMLGLIPLTGIPLIFISHGGSALMIALAEMGIVLNISRHQQTKK